MKNLILFLTIISLNIFAQGIDSTKSFQVSNSNKASLNIVQASKAAEFIQLNARIDSLKYIVKSTGNLMPYINILEKQIDSIKARNLKAVDDRRKLVNRRYMFGKNILNNMIDGTNYLQRLNNLLIIQPQVDTSADIFTRLHLQNVWDKINNYSPLISLAATGLSAVFIKNPTTTAIVGLSSVIVPGLFKLAFGHANISDFAAGLDYIGPTKNLYDEFDRRSFLIKELVVQDTILRDSLIAFRSEYDSVPDIDLVKNFYYLKLQDKISQYEKLNIQIPLTINQNLDYFYKYKDSPGFSYLYDEFKNHSLEFLNEYNREFGLNFRKLSDKNREMLFNGSILSFIN